MATRDTEHGPTRTTSRAMVLLITGICLLMPPVATMFHIESKLFDVPVTLIFLFAVWALLIFGAARLARPLRAVSKDEDPK